MERQFLSEIIGHDAACERLERLYRSGRIPNGLVIFGASGIGKRTLALAFARILLAGDANGVVNPRGKKARRIQSGSFADLQIIERETTDRQIKLERIRELRESFSLRPVEGDLRVGIIVDAEQLTEEAANALLKLLEEPPKGSVLVLTARASGAILETLTSRCRRLELHPLSAADISNFLRQREIPELRIPLLALASEGCPGRALELDAADFRATLLPLARDLVQSTRTPLASVEKILTSIREGTKVLEEARARLREVLRLAIWLGRMALRAEAHVPLGLEVFRLLSLEGEPWIQNPPREGYERRLLRLRSLGADIDRNINLDLLISGLALGSGTFD